MEHDLPREIEFLRRHDEAQRRIMEIVEMPDRLAQNLIKAQTSAEHAEAGLNAANEDLEAKERVLTDQQDRLLKER